MFVSYVDRAGLWPDPASTKQKGGRTSPPPSSTKKLVLAQNCVFGCLGDAELDHTFGLDLDSLAGCWITTHSSFAIRSCRSSGSGGYFGIWNSIDRPFAPAL